jgi:hypothetical protein
VPAPGAVTWSTGIEVLDQTGAARFPASADGLDNEILGHWYNADNTAATAKTPVAWTNPNGATPPPNNRGSVSATSPSIGHGNVQFRLSEKRFGSSGLLCRSQTMPAIPTGVQPTTRLLVPPPTTFTAQQLDELVASLPGTVIEPDNDTTVTIRGAELVPGPGVLAISISGRVTSEWFHLTYDGDFTYQLNLRLYPGSDAFVLREVIAVQAPHAGSLDLEPVGWTDAVMQEFAGNKEPKFRQAVLDKARTKINAAVAENPGVQFFTAMGYSASARAVTLTDAGLTVSAALCKFG